MSDYCSSVLQYKNLILLKNIGCCLICSLRFCGVNLLKETVRPEAIISKVKDLQDYKPLIDTIPCVACLGILQNNQLSSFIDKLVKEIDLFKYDCKTVSLALNVPIAAQIRDKAVHVYFTQNVNFGNDYKSKVKVQNIKDVWKWYLSPKIESLLNKRIETSNLTPSFIIDVLMSYPEDQKECLDLLRKHEKLTNDRILNKIYNEKNITKKTIDLIMDTISDEQFEKYFSIPPKTPTNFATIEKLLYKHDSIFIGGRYVKLSRRLSQTPWFINGEHKMENSVQELLCKCIMDYTKSKCIKFLSSGREDVDVRMLLNGRPFAIEVINPKMTQISESDLVHLNREINKGTGIVKTINGLKVLTKNNLKQLKEGECLKSKTYRALCIFKKMVDKSFIIETLQNVRNLKIIQNTPLRVIHRRALSPRERIIYQIRARFPNSEEFNSYKKQVKFIKEDWTYLIIDLNTQAGTYVKEFIHGDFGRTMPNLCYLLKTEIDIVALDVTNIALAWP